MQKKMTEKGGGEFSHYLSGDWGEGGAICLRREKPGGEGGLRAESRGKKGVLLP